MIGVVGFDGGSRPAVALALPPPEETSDEGEAEGGGGPGDETGACCLPDGTCEEVTFSECATDGGSFQGEGTTCDDVDCTHTGACCQGTNCSITTEDDCGAIGGVYQGDDTGCDPNPCEEMPPCNGCGFDAFDGSGRKFLTYTANLVGYDHVFAPFPDCSLDYDITTSYTISTVDCSTAVTCSGSSTNGAHVCSWFNDSGTCSFGSCDQGPLCNVGIPGDCNPNTGGGAIPISATEAICTAGDSGLGFQWSEMMTITLSDECTP